MSDRELLALAAKAAGIEGELTDYGVWPKGDFGIWRPHRDDGDALRLAVKLGLLVDTHGLSTKAGLPYQNWPAEKHGTDPFAATRRAIVRAAAEIGRNMK